jgi:GT2 family glycosyltransferase
MIPSGDNLALRYQARNNYMSPLHALSRRQLPFLPFADGANASFRRALFDEIGNFEESFFKSADVEICYRMLVLTDYKIMFCPDCVVNETGEPDLKALLHQRYRMGMGAYLLRSRFPEFFIQTEAVSPLRKHYWSARESLAGFGRFAAAALKLDRAAMEDSTVRYLMNVAQRHGFRRAAAYVQQQTGHPRPLDAERMKQFIAMMDHLDERILLRHLEKVPSHKSKVTST